MTESHKLVFTFDTSENKKFSVTLPNVDSGFLKEDVLAAGEAIKNAGVLQPKDGEITLVNVIKHVKTTVTEYLFK